MTQRLPHDRRSRYSIGWQRNSATHYETFLKPDMVLLDIGAGRSPGIPVEQRPAGCTYIGLDISADEMTMAPQLTYDEIIVGDIPQEQPMLSARVDLAIARQVLEHVASVGSALHNIHTCLNEGGHFVALLSGRNAHFAVLNRLLPESVAKYAMRHFLQLRPDTVFRAHYDHCPHSGLSGLMTEWNSITIVPLYNGAGYLSFFRPSSTVYLLYEDWVARANKTDLATHYIVVARK